MEASLASYYDHVGKIVACYDRNGRGWTGAPIRSAECVARLRAIDTQGKVEFIDGDYARSDDPMANDTAQRQEAVASAEKGADWVLQIDTDEVLPQPDRFLEALRRASMGEWQVLRYPNRIMRQHVRGDVYLEECNRLWLPLGGTLPLAVRPGTVLSVARESTAPSFRVGLTRQRFTALPGCRPNMTVGTRDALIHSRGYAAGGAGGEVRLVGPQPRP
ncbi:MAG: hypothetical protein ACR2MO_06685 [Acidimicrobiales bacterium]